MRKPLLFLFALLICLGTISDAVNQTNQKTDEGVQDVILDKTEAILACPWTMTVSKSTICNQENRQISLRTIAKDAEKKGLSFYYLITGGKIIGSGKDVVWDFTDVKPGDYSITVGVGKNGILKGNFITKKVVGRACGCHRPVVCPSISISSPTAPADAEDTLIFTTNISGGSQDYIAYNWTLTEGEIVAGQGTSQILVKTTKEMKGHTITAKVEIGGIDMLCQTMASASAEIKDK